jgi:Cu-Zn family superoxide dismutase
MRPVRRSAALVLGPILAIVVASSVAAGHGHPSPRHGYGIFVDPSGATIGFVLLAQDRHGDVRVHVHVRGLTTGLHGIHIHAVGSCATTATFADGAGGHYNPLADEHGLDNPNGPHAGDLPNLVVDSHGRGRLQATTDRVTLTAGPATLFDTDRSAFIIHASPDDQVTNIGNGGSGARIACAVVVPI